MQSVEEVLKEDKRKETTFLVYMNNIFRICFHRYHHTYPILFPVIVQLGTEGKCQISRPAQQGGIQGAINLTLILFVQSTLLLGSS